MKEKKKFATFLFENTFQIFLENFEIFIKLFELKTVEETHFNHQTDG